MDEKSRLIQRLDQARAELQAVLAELDAESEIYPRWTVKHLLAHLAGWDDAVIASLRAHAGGQEPGTPAVRGINHYNAQSVATREPLSYDRVVKECDLARDQLKALIDDMPPAKFQEPLLFPWGPTGTIAQLVAIFAEHEKEHAKEIRQLLAK